METIKQWGALSWVPVLVSHGWDVVEVYEVLRWVPLELPPTHVTGGVMVTAQSWLE